MRILVAGALGEVGRSLSAALAGRGHDIVPVSSRAPSADVDAVGLAEAADLVAGRRIDLVVNAAGRGDRRALDRSGTWAGEILAPAVAATATPAVLLSTMRVLEGYGTVVGEDAPPRPQTPYAEANARNEELWLAQAGPTAAVLRVANYVCAPSGAESPQALLLPWSLVTEAAVNGRVRVRSAPHTSREFVAAEDVASALEVLVRDRPASRVCATVPGWLATLEDLVGAMQAAFVQAGRGVPGAEFGSEGGSPGRWPPGWLAAQGWECRLDAARMTGVIAQWLTSVRLD